jgi:CRP-like cAMP-binding protein
MSSDLSKGESVLVPFLAGSTFLGGLPEAALLGLVRRGHTRRFKRGETLFSRGDDGDSLMVLTSGRIKIFNVTAEGREVALNFLGRGDITGEIAVLDGGPRTASGVALEDSEAFVLHRRDLIPVLKANPDALMEIVEALCQKLRLTSDQVEDALREMAERLARGLVRLMNQHGRRTAAGIVIDMKLTQRDIGTYTGLSRENTSRQLGQLRAAGIVALEGADIVILKPEALVALAGTEEA